MNLADRIISLQHIFPFSRLRETELTALAEVCSVRHYEPGETVLEADRNVKRLLVCVRGDFMRNQVRLADRILGVQSLLFDGTQKESIQAGPEGVTCLALEKGHFFRSMYELPEVAQGMVALQARQEVST